MLYDNALLARAYLHAWQITGKPHYRQIVQETLNFVIREMRGEEGGFYSSLDADSEGVEGKFYVWTKNEIEKTLGNDYVLFEAAYGITSHGNWEGKIVLQRALDDKTLAARFDLDREQVSAKLTECHEKLLDARGQRIRPGTDDKVLTEWNGLMLIAFAEAARIFDSEEYLTIAQTNADFLLTALRPDGQLRRAWRKGQVGNEVFLADYAALILSLLELYQTDFNNRWFTTAQELAKEMIEKFIDRAGGFFDTTQESSEKSGLPIRPKELQDNAVPSGNALAAEALLKLDALNEGTEYHEYTETALGLVSDFVTKYPTAFAQWLSAADFSLQRTKQVAIVGDPKSEDALALLKEVRSTYRPNTVVTAAPYPIPEDAPTLLEHRTLQNDQPTAYVCEGFTCKLPVNTVKELHEQLKDPH